MWILVNNAADCEENDDTIFHVTETLIDRIFSVNVQGYTPVDVGICEAMLWLRAIDLSTGMQPRRTWPSESLWGQ
ncbi:MAG: hypothetical protein LBD40_01610 [Puniceicoccales bacterium]|nr:hypothetical protein [Puniceicoccales bacterium]